MWFALNYAGCAPVGIALLPTGAGTLGNGGHPSYARSGGDFRGLAFQ